jgi:TonB family protein
MSTAKSVSAFSAGLTLVAASCWFITAVFPLHAAPQIATDSPGVTCDVRGAELLHRDSVLYPANAFAKGIQGTVVADLKLDSSGNVSDATIASGPDELRRSVLQSVLNWHFAPGAGPTREISVTFALPAAGSQPVPTSVVRPNGVTGGVGGGIGAASVIKSISITGLSDLARDQLSSQLPVSVGETLTGENLARLINAVRAFDSHLTVRTARASDTEIAITIARNQASPLVAAPPPPPPPPPPPGTVGGPDAINIGPEVQATKIISQAKPTYPPLAKAAHVQGTVEFRATIGKDGKVQNLLLLSGPPLLVQAAMEAVQQWVYQPTLLNGNPVEVITTIDVNFTLSQ